MDRAPGNRRDSGRKTGEDCHPRAPARSARRPRCDRHTSRTVEKTMRPDPPRPLLAREPGPDATTRAGNARACSSAHSTRRTTGPGDGRRQTSAPKSHVTHLRSKALNEQRRRCQRTHALARTSAPTSSATWSCPISTAVQRSRDDDSGGPGLHGSGTWIWRPKRFMLALARNCPAEKGAGMPTQQVTNGEASGLDAGPPIDGEQQLRELAVKQLERKRRFGMHAVSYGGRLCRADHDLGDHRVPQRGWLAHERGSARARASHTSGTSGSSIRCWGSG